MTAALEISDLRKVLAQGASDFRRAPLFGLFFSGFYVLCGFGLTMLGAGSFTWTLVLLLGFPLLAPFAALGLYEVSRRLHAGDALSWRSVLFNVWRERGGQAPWIGAIILMVFLFWSFFAHMLMALFLGNMRLINVSTSLQILQTPNGMALIAVELAVGAVVAFFTFSITVISLPMVLEEQVDFITAILRSIRLVRDNILVMFLWAALIATALILSLLPAFLGLFVTLPILGHATWHLYRRVTHLA